VTASSLPPETLRALAELPALIHAQRTRAGVSQRTLALELGVSCATVSNLEAGTRPDLGTLIALAAWLGIPLAWFAPESPEADGYRRGWDDCTESVTAALKRGGSS